MPNAPPSNLTEKECDCLDNVLSRSPEILQVMREALACGLPMEDFVNALERDISTCQRLKARFFPNRP